MSEAAQAEGNPATPKKETGGKKGGQSGARVFAPHAPKFEGKCPELKGYIYDAADSRQSDQFVKTTREIAEYVGRTYKYGGDIRLAVETLKPPSFRMPDDPPEVATKTALKIWEKDIDEYSRAKFKYAENVKTLFSLVWGQCTDVMRQKVEDTKTFETINKACNGIGLLLSLKKAIAFQFQGQKYLPHAVHEALKRYYNCARENSQLHKPTWITFKTHWMWFFIARPPYPSIRASKTWSLPSARQLARPFLKRNLPKSKQKSSLDQLPLLSFWDAIAPAMGNFLMIWKTISSRATTITQPQSLPHTTL
jgi:hypothetical protein